MTWYASYDGLKSWYEINEAKVKRFINAAGKENLSVMTRADFLSKNVSPADAFAYCKDGFAKYIQTSSGAYRYINNVAPRGNDMTKDSVTSSEIITPLKNPADSQQRKRTLRINVNALNELWRHRLDSLAYTISAFEHAAKSSGMIKFRKTRKLHLAADPVTKLDDDPEAHF